jgi:hypothetical protein
MPAGGTAFPLGGGFLGGGLAGGLNVTLNASPSSAAAGQVVTFFYRASPPAVAPPFASITNVSMAYGDGSFDSGNTGGPGQTVTGSFTHVYNFPGTFTATLSANASNGGSGSAVATVYVGGGGGGGGVVSVSVNASPTVVSVNQPVYISYSATTSAIGIGFPTVRSMLISYGDGSAPLPLNPPSGSVSYSYSSPGYYTVTVTATDTNGNQGQGTTAVQVYGGPGPGPAPIPPPGPPPSPGFSVNYPAGWNLVAAPNGTSIPNTSGPLYTWQAGYGAYQSAFSTQAGWGYWAYLPTGGSVSYPYTGPQTITRALQPGQFVMIGNSSSSPATVYGADIVYTYSPYSGYQQTTFLQPGQGAWAFSFSGGNATITSPGP